MDLFALCEVFYKKARDSSYMRNYMKNRYHSTRNKLIEELGGKCVECGTKDRLELDHIDRTKKTMRMADIHSVSDARLQEEKKNIQILCYDCHKEKTHKAWDHGTNKPEHGTYWMYRKHGCRCDKCIKAYKDKNKEWNAAR